MDDVKVKCADAGTSCESCEDCPYSNECLIWREFRLLRIKLENQIFISKHMTDGLIRACTMKDNPDGSN